MFGRLSRWTQMSCRAPSRLASYSSTCCVAERNSSCRQLRYHRTGSGILWSTTLAFSKTFLRANGDPHCKKGKLEQLPLCTKDLDGVCGLPLI